MVTIQASEENWRWLRNQKGPTESFDDVLSRLRERVEQQPATPTVDVDAIAEREGLGDDEREAVAAIIAMVKTNHPGWTEKGEIIDHIQSEHPAGKTAADHWWRRLVSERGLHQTVDLHEKGLIRLRDK